MICYRDTTFCTYYQTCANQEDCNRKLTPEVKEAAIKWWGSDQAPVAMFADYPYCFEIHSTNEDEELEDEG